MRDQNLVVLISAARRYQPSVLENFEPFAAQELIFIAGEIVNPCILSVDVVQFLIILLKELLRLSFKLFGDVKRY